MEAIYTGAIDYHRLAELAPVVFKAAAAGDAVAGVMSSGWPTSWWRWCARPLRRLRLTQRELDVVLGGGIVRGGASLLLARITRRRARAVPARPASASIDAPPVVGAALLGLDQIGAATEPARRARLREMLTSTTA